MADRTRVPSNARRYLNAAHFIVESARELADVDPDVLMEAIHDLSYVLAEIDPDEAHRRAQIWNDRWEDVYG